MHADGLPLTGTCDLSTIGRRSGRPRRVEIWYVLVDDGHLDCVLLSPKGLPGWVDISAQVLAGRGRGLRSPRLIRRTGERFEVSVDHPEAIELDGDVIGTATRIVATIEPRSLIVRVPAVTDPSPPTPAGS